MTLSYFNLLPSRPHILGVWIAFVLSGGVIRVHADNIQFNTDVLDVKERENIDLGRFSRGGFIMPGNYNMAVKINTQELPEQEVLFIPPESDLNGSEACISPQLVEQFGLKPAVLSEVAWWNEGQCLVVSSLPGLTARGELGTSTLYINLPQIYLEYTSANWDPPSRWEAGIPGLLLDYNVNTHTQRQLKNNSQSYNLSGNGTVGANLGAWRLRANWQARLDHQTGSGQPTKRSLDWSRYYAYRAIPRLRARLTMGEDYLTSDIFDSFRFAGLSLVSDDNMLPPNLRGYAPEVTGVARTNAKVVISQQGRVLQETYVAVGAFRIQDLNDAISGRLDIRVEEQDGSVQEFQMQTASIPYLTRPGSLRYKIAAGRPSDFRHRTNGPLFTTGEFSWGISNGWSMYGGGVVGGDYNALAGGIGRDLMMLGALSFDMTHSRASLPHEKSALSGSSYRMSYSKRFDDYDSQVTFAGYRFSERKYMTMGEYLDARTYGTRPQSSKEMYTITFNKQFRDLGLSAYLNYSHQTYWDRPTSDNYSLTLSRYFDLWRFKNLSLSLNGYRNKNNGRNDDGMHLSLSMPFGRRGSISYSSSLNRNDNSHQMSYHDNVNGHDYYQVNSGVSRSGVMASGSYTHQGDLSQIGVNASYQEGHYTSVGLSLQGGVTATAKGAALHRAGSHGGTRILVDADGVAGIPIRGSGAATRTNRFGKAVVSDVISYYRNRVSIDLDRLPDNAEVTRSVAQATLTEGAIGYRRFEVVAGEKAMAVIRLADGSYPPFGASIFNRKQQEVGIVNDGGSVYLSGMNAGEQMSAHWAGSEQCVIDLPLVPLNPGVSVLPELLLLCHQPIDKSSEPEQ
ncbi:outer membrane usher protein [Erwinia sorbitola]|uniref:Outer membrane usher protein n=1 Tax=Erwinia sorbitola TaxID=2681984 RepID=A0A6I6E9U8_9GAMM|nr:outer membrane usher protein [Erwinia sorbitola]MTD28400.1 outer membrane usher protein [Erwinia sorbitola]QGU86517.1 outer membrane usher protein [Erwinia sorbitola]